MATVLTVDDSPSVRQVVKITLGREGHTVVEAADGAEGLAKAKVQPFDLVITDLNRPVMDGITMIRHLRALPSFTGTPLVFLTTESDEAAKRDARAAGASGWITKPFKPEVLLNVVAKLVRP